MTLYNRRYFTRQTIEIKKAALAINRKTLFDEAEYETSFEHLDNKKKVQVLVNNDLVVTGIIFLLISVFLWAGSVVGYAVIFTFTSIIMLTASFVNRKKIITIANYAGEPIVLFFTSENKTEVLEFVDEIFKAADSFLLNKFGKIDKDLPIEPQLDSLLFLKNRDILSEEQFQTLKNQLLGKEIKTQIGFGNNS
jgi:ribosomal protein L10